MGISWFYDIIIIAIIVISYYLGSRKGFVKMLLVLAGYVVACIGAYFISDIASESVYNKMLKSKVEQTVYSNVENINFKEELKKELKEKGIEADLSDSELDSILNNTNDISGKLAETLKKKNSALNIEDVKEKTSGIFSQNSVLKSIEGKVPDKLYNEIKTYFSENGNTADELISAMNNPDENERAKEITELAVKPIVLSFVRYLLFIICFIILLIVLKIVIKMICKVVDIVPIISGANKFFGGIIGLAQGILLIFVLVMAIKLWVGFSSGDMLFFNSETIEKTKIFKQIYNINLLG